MQLKIEYLPIDQIKPYERNARKHENEDVGAIVNSIKEFGFDDPIGIWGEDNVIVEGHGRLKAAKQLNMSEVPVIRLDHLTDEQRRAYALAHNKTAELSEWNEFLDIELGDILDIDMEEFGFDLSEDDIEEPEIEEDEAPEPPTEPKAKLGDLYILGNSRLICGDSTDVAVIDRLMDGVKADMLFTSPPYSDMREYNGGKDLSVSNVSNFISAYRPYVDYQCVNLGIQRKNHEIVQYWDEYIAKARECGYKLLAWNVWDKMECGSIGQQSAFFPIRHEWIFVFGTEFYEINLTQQKKSQSITAKGSPKGTNTRRQADGSLRRSSRGDQSHPLKQMESVLQLTPVKVHDIDHPAPFPVQLPAEYIKAMTDEGGTVIEPFGGSGSTLIACEQLNRKCYMAELDSRYVSVIVNRWLNLTGRKDEIFCIRDGQRLTYDEVFN